MVDENEIKDWYNQRHLEKGTNAWRSPEAYQVFLDYLDVKPGKKLLDIGCGTGYFLKAATEKGLETYGIDISTEGVKIAQRNSPNSQVAQGKGEQLNFPDEYFDYVVCLGALEHFIDVEKGISEMTRVARSDALFCIMVPNINYIYWKIIGKPGTEQYDINEMLLSLDDWKSKFNSKFEIIKIYQDVWCGRKINNLPLKSPLRLAANAIGKLVYILLPLKYTYQFIFIMKKKK